MAATHFSGPVISAAGFQVGELGSVGSFNSGVTRKAGLVDTVAAAILTITVPNAIVNAGLFLDIVGHLTTGESTRVATGAIAIARTPGASAVAVAAALAQAAIATVAAGATLTLAYAVGAAAGPAGGVQTLTVTVTSTASAGAVPAAVVVAVRGVNSGDGGVVVTPA